MIILKIKKSDLIEIIIGILLFLIIFLIIIFLTEHFRYLNNYENDISELESTYTNRVFSVDKIIVYSSAYATDSTTTKSSINISQFSDIALFVNNNSGNIFTKENTIKDLYIDNIKLSRKFSWNTKIIL